MYSGDYDFKPELMVGGLGLRLKDITKEEIFQRANKIVLNNYVPLSEESLELAVGFVIETGLSLKDLGKILNKYNSHFTDRRDDKGQEILGSLLEQAADERERHLQKKYDLLVDSGLSGYKSACDFGSFAHTSKWMELELIGEIVAQARVTLMRKSGIIKTEGNITYLNAF